MHFGQRPTGAMKSLTLAELDELRAIGGVRNYRKNETIYELGHPAEQLYMVMKGRVRLRDRDRDGRDVVVAFAADSEIFGYEVMSEYPRRILSAVAAEACEVLSVDGARLKGLMERHVSLQRNLTRYMGASILHQAEQLKMMAFLDVPTRLAGTILWFADRYGQARDGAIEVPYWFTHQEMADLIGSTRETVTTVLAQFKRDGLIVSRNHHFIILDRGALTRKIGLPNFGPSQ